jgi:hypothetical protein
MQDSPFVIRIGDWDLDHPEFTVEVRKNVQAHSHPLKCFLGLWCGITSEDSPGLLNLPGVGQDKVHAKSGPA